MEQFVNNPWFLLLLVWSFVWKGLALWRAVKSEQKYWFVVLLVINTAGLLEILYLFRFAKKRMNVEELKFWEYSKKS